MAALSATRILGIDPGWQRTGVGIIDADHAGKTRYVYHAALELLNNDTFPLRLKQIFDDMCALIDEHRPDEVAIERVFMARNPDSALKLGQARGVALATLATARLKVAEFAAVVRAAAPDLGVGGGDEHDRAQGRGVAEEDG